MAMRPGRIAIRPYKLFIHTVNQQRPFKNILEIRANQGEAFGYNIAGLSVQLSPECFAPTLN